MEQVVGRDFYTNTVKQCFFHCHSSTGVICGCWVFYVRIVLILLHICFEGLFCILQTPLAWLGSSTTDPCLNSSKFDQHWRWISNFDFSCNGVRKFSETTSNLTGSSQGFNKARILVLDDEQSWTCMLGKQSEFCYCCIIQSEFDVWKVKVWQWFGWIFLIFLIVFS